ncbi:MAG: tetratricopeptide repeat protein [Pyrinomonadaceae bacterium]
MYKSMRVSLVVLVFFVFSSSGAAQIDEICTEAGLTPSLDSPFANIPYVFGKVALRGFVASAKLPKVTVIFSDREQSEVRWTTGKSGSYCFKRNNASGGLLVIEVDGIEAIRRSLPSFGPNQQREDFEITSTGLQKQSPPGTISAKFSRPPNEKTAALYRKVFDAEKNSDKTGAIGFLKEIVKIDPDDYVAWAKLGTIYFGDMELAEAETAFRHSLESRVDYTPSWINMGKLRSAQERFDTAIEIFKHALELEPNSAHVYRLLGEAYLQAKSGNLGAQALNKAIALDPTGMSECHLLLAKLYDLAGAKDVAANEYKLFLGKVPEHPDKKKFEKYIKDNSK